MAMEGVLMIDKRPVRWIVGVSGASGIGYARRLVELLLELETGLELHLVVSDAAARVMHDEDGLSFSGKRPRLEDFLGSGYTASTCDQSPSGPAQDGDLKTRVVFHSNQDIGASIASGSFIFEGMVVVPCSMASLAAISSGYGQNLLHRAADVTLKEGRKLILVPRETPLSVVHLENMLRLGRMGVCMLAAMPGFYHAPQSVEDLIDSVVMRIGDQMGIELAISRRWKENLEDKGKDVTSAKVYQI